MRINLRALVIVATLFGAACLGYATSAQVTTIPASGGVVTVYSRTVTLTNTQVLALHTTSVEIVPAAGVETIIQPVSVALIGNFSAGNYTNISATGFMSLLYDNGVEASGYIVNAAGLSDSLSTFFAPSGGRSYSALTPQWYLDGGAFGSVGNTLSVADTANKPVVLNLGNGSDLTGGNAANTLLVVVWYGVMEL